MKKSLLFLLAFSPLFFSCQPRDPSVLSRDEKQREADRRKPRGVAPSGESPTWKTSKYPVLPPNEIAALTQLILERQSQIFRMTSLILELSHSRERQDSNCVISLSQNRDLELQSRWQLKNCAWTSNRGNQTSKGVIEVTAKRSNDGLTEIHMKSAAISDRRHLRTQVSRPGFEGSALLDDEFEVILNLKNQDPLTYEIALAQFYTVAEISTPQAQKAEIELEFSGEFSLLKNEQGPMQVVSNLKSEFSYQGQIAGGVAGAKPVLIRTQSAEGSSATETLGTCPTRTGKLLLNAEFLSKIENQIVEYNEAKVQLFNSKSQPQQTWEGTGCTKLRAQAPTPWVDWTQYFLFNPRG